MIPASTGAVLDRALAERPDSPALVAPSGTLTYRELDAAAARAAGALLACGVRPGDRVVGCLPNDLDVVVAFHAAMRVGAIWAGVGEHLTGKEQDQLVAQVGPRVVLGSDRCRVGVARVIGPDEWADRCRRAEPAGRVPDDLDRPAGIGFTSGTTGRPAAVVHSQRNLLLPGAVLAASRGWTAELRKADTFSLSILNLHVLSTLLVPQTGGCAVVSGLTKAQDILEWAVAHRATVWNGAPAQAYDIARHPEWSLGALREIWSGGGDTSADLLATFAAAHGRSLTATYGLTEAPTVVAIDPDGEHRPGTSGRVLPHLDVAAYDDAGRRLSPGEVGELRIAAASQGRSAGIWRPLLGYWRDGGVVAPASGPVRTGDIGRVDQDSWLTVVDRKKLVIVRGGANVYPAEVERVLAALPGVARAAVVGVPDQRLGERVGAVVEPLPGWTFDPTALQRLRADCARSLARYKVPERWATSPALPLNAMGKVVRADLAERFGAGEHHH